MRPAAVFVLTLCVVSSCVSTNNGEKAATAPEEDDGGLLLKPLMVLIHRHRRHGTRVDGPRCPLYPSCAAYADSAIRRYSFLGLMIFIDRLFFRETGDLSKKYLRTPRRLSRGIRYYDPLEDALPLLEERRPSLLTEDFH